MGLCQDSILALIRLTGYHDGPLARNWNRILLISIIINCNAFIIEANNITHHEPKWLSTQLEGHANKILLNRDDGSVFVAIDSAIYRYDKNLKLMTKTKEFPRANPNNHSEKVLSLVQLGQSGLLSCQRNSSFNLNCYLYKTDNLEISRPLRWSDKSKELKVDKSNQLNSIKTLTRPNSDEYAKLLFTSDRGSVIKDDQTSEQYLPAIGHFIIDGGLSTIDLDVSVLRFTAKESEDYVLYDFIFSFDYKSYTHFILNDRRQRTPASIVSNTVKIARKCNENNAFLSYTEISLKCSGHDNIEAKVAHIVEENKSDPKLFVVFETNNGASHTETHLCSYDLNSIELLFNSTINNCNLGQQRIPLSKKVLGGPSQEWCQEASFDHGACGSRLNPYIDASSIEDYTVIDSSTGMSLHGMAGVNFLHQTVQEGKIVFFVGTDSGQISKIEFTRGQGRMLYTIDLPSNHVMGHVLAEYKFPERNLSAGKALYTVNSRNLFAFSSNRLNLLSMDECYYTSCQACFTSGDTLNCAWCGDSCSRETECPSSKKSEWCSPIIHDFTPKVGPTTGSTLLRIKGENFGSSGGKIQVKVGNSECDVQKKFSSSEEVQCLTRATGRATNATIQLNIEDDGLVRIEGSTSSETLFHYVNVSKLESTPLAPIEPEDYMGFLVILLFMTALLVLIVLALYSLRIINLPKIRMKLQPTLNDNKKSLTDQKVSYNNPESHKFSNSIITISGDSSHGRINLDGSIRLSEYFSKQDQLEQDKPLMNHSMYHDMVSLLAQEKILIKRDKLTLGHVLGAGQFGRVHKGFLKDEITGEHVAVAVKTLHNRITWDDADDIEAFLEEGKTMRHFQHENVLPLIGVAFDTNGLPMVITPLMSHGDLRSYIFDGMQSSPTVAELIGFGTQVAKGMAYLSNLRFVHRDLAARNCMLDENLTVKIADFGLSRDIYERDYYTSDNMRTKLPVKWMAIESLEQCLYTTKTDVWSYGVLLWELLMRGVMPYPDVDNFDILSYLKSGRRMDKPSFCPMILYNIMLSCWRENPAHRPTFDELVVSVPNVINQLGEMDRQQRVSRDIIYCDGPI